MEEIKLEKVYKDLDLGNHFQKCKKTLTSLKLKIDEIRQLRKDPYFFINNHFTELRNEIDIEREHCKEIVDTHFLGLIDEVYQIEAESKKKSERTELLIGIENSSQLEKELEEYDEKFRLLKEDLDELKIDTEK